MNSKAKKWMLMVALVAMVAAIGVGFSSRIYAATKKTTMVKRIEVTYNKNLRIKNGSYCSGSLLRKLKLDATAIGKEGRRLNIPVVIREYGTYLNSNGKTVSLTLQAGGKVKKIKIKLLQVNQVNVKIKGKLPEGKKLTNARLYKAVRVDVLYQKNQEIRNYKGGKCLQKGKVIKPNKKGFFKVGIQVGKKKITVYVPVQKKSSPSKKPVKPSPTAIPPAKPETFKVTVKEAEGGSTQVNEEEVNFINGVAELTFKKGNSAIAKPFAKTGYNFSHWIVRGKEVKDEILTLTESVEIKPIFTKMCQLTIQLDGIDDSSLIEVKIGEQVLTFVDKVATISLPTGTHHVALKVLSTELQFNNWSDGKRPISLEMDHDFSLVSSRVVYLNFSMKGYTTVTYKHDTGQIIDTQSVMWGEAGDKTPNENMSKPNADFIGWLHDATIFFGKLGASPKEFVDKTGKTLDEEIRNITVTGDSVELISCYQEKVKPKYEVSIEGGTLTLDDGTEHMSGSIIELETDTRYRLKPTIPDGFFFSGWYKYLETGEEALISLKEDYVGYVSSKIHIIAHYEENPVEIVPRTWFYGETGYHIDWEAKKYTLYMKRELPEGCDRIQWGLVYTKNMGRQVDIEELQLENVNNDTIRRVVREISEDTWDLTSSFPVTADTQQYRVYMVIRTPEGEEKTIYSEAMVTLELPSRYDEPQAAYSIINEEITVNEEVQAQSADTIEEIQEEIPGAVYREEVDL